MYILLDYQVSNAVDLSNLVQRLQEERASVALNIFLERSPSDDLHDLQQLVKNDMDIRKYTLIQVRSRADSLKSLIFIIPFMQSFNATDTVLQTVTTWPDISAVDFFESKLKFQIQHSIFRTKVHINKYSVILLEKSINYEF